MCNEPTEWLTSFFEKLHKIRKKKIQKAYHSAFQWNFEKYWANMNQRFKPIFVQVQYGLEYCVLQAFWKHNSL